MPIFSRFLDSLLLIIVGCAAVGDGLRIIITKQSVVGGIPAGGWIAGLGALLVVGTCVYVARHVITGPANAVSGPALLLKAPVIAFAMLILYVALLDSLGYVLATGLFMAVYLRLFGRYRILTVAAIAVSFAIGSGWLWAVMNMTLPQGPLPWP
jgi:hypothetical protein